MLLEASEFSRVPYLKVHCGFFPTPARARTDCQDGPGPWSFPKTPAVGPHRTLRVLEQGGMSQEGLGSWRLPALWPAFVPIPLLGETEPACGLCPSLTCGASGMLLLKWRRKITVPFHVELFSGGGKGRKLRQGHPPPTGAPLTRGKVPFPHVVFRG